jgi:hypothetical protein
VPEPFPFAADGERFEVVSRGDHVPGRLWLGPSAKPRPLVLVAPALGAGKDAHEVGALCRALVGEGFVAAAIDLPLQGERASAKLSARLAACAAHAARSGGDALLWEEFLRQASLDLAAARAALARRRDVAQGRGACVAFEPGADAAAAWAAREPSLAACLRAERGADAAGLARRVRNAFESR